MAYILLIGLTILIIFIALSIYFCLKSEGNNVRRNQLNNYPIIVNDNSTNVKKLDLLHQAQRNVFVIDCCEKSNNEKQCQQELPPSYCSLFPEWKPNEVMYEELEKNLDSCFNF